MKDYSRQHKAAWEFDAYDFWVRQSGTPQERAAEDKADPVRMLRKYAAYFDRYEGVRIANICGSCGKKAVPLALLGAEVTVFDISEDNRRYALETAEAAGTHLDYVTGDVMETDLNRYGGYFDIVFMGCLNDEPHAIGEIFCEIAACEIWNPPTPYLFHG